jgi:SAM-dependent methyltransferase
MSRDVLLYNSGSSDKQAALMAWAKDTPGLHTLYHPDYHRLQLERWIWGRREELGHTKMDVGQSETPRRWMGDGYFTFGLYNSDVIGDLLDIPLKPDSVDGVIMTEVLEHCTDPLRAVSEVHRVMRPGGLLLVTSPFIWPDHRTLEYPDYWRFTEQAWELLLKDFSDVKIEAVEWTEEGAQLWSLLRRFECFGYETNVKAATGYLVEAVR